MILDALGFVARHGRICLVLGLVAGLAAPGLAATLRPWLPEMVATLLFLTAFRIGPAAALESLDALRQTGTLLLILQLVLPVSAALFLSAAGLIGLPLALAAVLLLAAPSVTGAPNFAILLGHDPVPVMRLLVLGTAILPITVLPVFVILPELGDYSAVLTATGRLMTVILGATAGAFLLRHWKFRTLGARGRMALDGATSIALAVVVIALMSAIAPAFDRDPWLLLGWLVAAFTINFGLQISTFLLSRVAGLCRIAVPVSIVAGNRNIALFLVALPEETTDPLLIFIGCYQIPMYLTPILMRRLYGRSDIWT